MLRDTTTFAEEIGEKKKAETGFAPAGGNPRKVAPFRLVILIRFLDTKTLKRLKKRKNSTVQPTCHNKQLKSSCKNFSGKTVH
jgi:hypothetical protein